MMRFCLLLAALVAPVSDAAAGPLRNRIAARQSAGSYAPATVPAPYYAPTPADAVPAAAGDALAEVNAARAVRGLPPYIHDAGLAAAAQSAAAYRAQYQIKGHTFNDFAFLPAGSSANAAGCGALEPSWGFRACTVYDRYTYAGAATVPGPGGVLYHHIFVR